MKLRLDEGLLRCQLLALGGLMVCQCLGKPRLASVLFTLTFLLTLGIWLAMAAVRIHRLSLLSLVLVLGALGGVAVNAMLTGTAVSLAYFKKGIMFSATVLLFGSLWGYVPRKDLTRFLFRWNTALAVFFTVMYLLFRPRMYLLNGRESGYLTFRFTSPNLTAVFLSALAMLEGIQLAAARRKGEKLLHLLLTAVLSYFVLLTRARNAQLMLVSFFLLAFLLRRQRAIPKGLAALLAVFPLLFAAGYALLIGTEWIREAFSFLSGEGKGLDSRSLIWRFAWEAFLQSPLAGAYSQISGGTGASQMHNSHLDVLVSYGFPVFCFFCVFLYGLLANAPAQQGRIGCLCRLAFGALLLSGLGEAMLFSGGMGIYLFPGMMLMLANFDFDRYEDLVFQ